MDISNILSISGKPGLYKMVGQMKNGLVVESLTDQKRFPAYATDKVSALEDISIYGESEDIPLKDIFQMIFEKEDGKETISPNSSANELKSYFNEIVAEYDEERVYVSDIKKVLRWYNLLLAAGLVSLEAEEAGEEPIEEAEVVEEESSSEESADQETADDAEDDNES